MISISIAISRHEVEFEAGLGPCHRAEAAGRRQRDIGGLHVRPTEADVGRVDIGHLDLAHDLPRGRDDGDVAGYQGRDADITAGLDREAVEALEAGETADAASAERRWKRR